MIEGILSAQNPGTARVRVLYLTAGFRPDFGLQFLEEIVSNQERISHGITRHFSRVNCVPDRFQPSRYPGTGWVPFRRRRRCQLVL